MPRGTERATIASPVAPFNVLPRATVLPPLHPGPEQRRGDGFLRLEFGQIPGRGGLIWPGFSGGIGVVKGPRTSLSIIPGSFDGTV